jgi:hypothetical protein
MPGRQDNLQRAEALGFAALATQTPDQFLWLGAIATGTSWRLSVLDDAMLVDLAAKRITVTSGQEVGPAWRILALHYLAITARPERLDPQITFADLPGGRTYSSVYQQRAIARLCATAGRDEQRMRSAALALGGSEATGGDVAFDFAVFPRLGLRAIWHARDDEFPPSATLLLPSNIESYFCIEDIVVLSERLVSRLGGGRF